MRKILVTIILMMYAFIINGQTNFEEGYYIDNNHQKVSGFIKNYDWKSNPSEIEFKKTLEASATKLKISKVSKFSIKNQLVFIRATVDIDNSNNYLYNMSESRLPEFEEKTVFLKLIIDGEADLLRYESNKLLKFFYRTKNEKYQPLVFKNYKKPNNSIAENNQFRIQLQKDLRCSYMNSAKFKSVRYVQKELVKLFNTYNTCVGTKSISYVKKNDRQALNYSIRPRLNMNNLSISNSVVPSLGTDFGGFIGYGLGVEIEYILPFNNNKWAVIFEPTFNTSSTNTTRDIQNSAGNSLTSEYTNSTLGLGIGARHYFFLNNDSKIFTNFSFLIDLSVNSEISSIRTNNTVANTIEPSETTTIGLGLGYSFKNKLSVEMRYVPSKDLFNNFAAWNSNYNSLGLILGYNL